MQRVILLFILAASLFAPTAVLAQNSSEYYNHRFEVGAGYNISFNPNNIIDYNPYEVSMKYTLTDRHSFYATIPMYFENKNQHDKDAMNLRFKHFGGIGVGYNYHLLRVNNFGVFCGIGVDYMHEHIQSKYYYQNEQKEEVAKTVNDHCNFYAVSPQGGADYRIGHFRTEIKYKFMMSRITGAGEGLKSHCLRGLSTSLYYMF